MLCDLSSTPGRRELILLTGALSDLDMLCVSETLLLGEQEVQTKEIKNGRLAMVAFVGFIIQAQATGQVSATPCFFNCLLPTHLISFIRAVTCLNISYSLLREYQAIAP